MQLVATEIDATYQLVHPFRLPFHSGSMLRGVLGRALRSAGCANRAAACELDCERPNQCTYTRLFDPPVPDPLPHRFLKGQTKAPQPLIPVFPSPGQREYRIGDEFPLSLRLLGPLRNGEMDALLAALERVGDFDLGDERGRITCERVTLPGHREILIATEATPNVEKVEIEFETPAWLEHDGRLMTKIMFQPFFRSIYRRLTILCALYGQGADKADADFSSLDALARNIEVVKHDVRPVDWDRHSMARDRHHRMQGVLGRVAFAGNELRAFVPMLRLAEKTHIGKATSFGLGRIRVSAER